MLHQREIERRDEAIARSLAFRDGGKSDAALAAIQEALAIDPDHGDAHRFAGAILFGRPARTSADLAHAIEHFQRALEIDPDDGPLYGLANALVEAGRSAEAVALMESVSRDGAAADSWRRATADNWLGGYFADKDVRLDRAVAHLRQAAADSPEWAEPWYRLGLALHRAGSPEESEAAFTRAAELGHIHAMNKLGLMLFSNGKKDPSNPAFVWFSNAAEQGNAYATTMMGVCYERGVGVTRDFALAEKYYRISAATGDAFSIRALRHLPFIRHPLLRHRDRIILFVGYALLTWQAFHGSFSLAVAPIAAVFGALLAVAAVGGMADYGNKAQLQQEVEEISMMLPGTFSVGMRLLLRVPAEDGFFIVPLMWLGVTPLSVTVFSILWAAAHYPNFTWRASIWKAAYVPCAAWLLQYGFWNVVVVHLLIDMTAFMVFSVWSHRQTARPSARLPN